VGAAPVAAKVGHIGARFEHEGAAQLAVKWMLDDYIEDLAAIVHQNLQFLLRAVWFMTAGEDGANRGLWARHDAISARSGFDLRAARTQNCKVLHNALAAHAEQPRDLIALNGNLSCLQQALDLLSPRAATVGLREPPGRKAHLS